MDISIAGFTLTFRLPSFGLRRQNKEKIHHFTRQGQGWDHFLSPVEDSNKIYMTADHDGIKRHDYIVLNDETGSTRYQVEEIEYYGDSPTIWTALLVER
jgi:hypothetical protein